MTIYYVDPEGGNDNNAGTSFSQRWKTPQESYWGATDEIRFIASPDPTLIGSGKVQLLGQRGWTQGESFTSAVFSTTTGASSFTYNGSLDSTGTYYMGHQLNTGDTIYVFDSIYSELNGTHEITKVDLTTFTIDGYTGSTNGSSSFGLGKFVNLSGRRVQLSSAVTENIACFGHTSGWTAANGCSASHDVVPTNNWYALGNTCEGNESDTFTIPVSTASGTLCAYWATGTLNLSGYQQVSLRYRTLGYNSGGHEPGKYSLRLCTDTAGQTPVHSIDLSARGARDGGWVNITKDFGSALNSSIQSVAIYTDYSTQTSYNFKIRNIIACKASSSADSLTHSSLIGLNTASDPDWFGIESINGTRVMLHSCRANSQADVYNYYAEGLACSWSASNNNADIYKRETLKRDSAQVNTQDLSSSTYWFRIHKGTSSYAVPPYFTTFSGGWDRTSMSTQPTGAMSYLDGVITRGTCLEVQYPAYYPKVERLGFVRFYKGMNVQSSTYYPEFNQLAFTDCDNYGIYSQSSLGFWKFVVNHCTNCVYGITANYMKALQVNPSYNYNLPCAYADRDFFKIRSTCNSGEALRLEYMYGYTPFKSLYLSHTRNRALVLAYNSLATAIEAETLNVSYNGSNMGVLGNDSSGYIFHTVDAKQTSPVFQANSGNFTIGSIDNQIQFAPGLCHPGENAGNYNYSLNVSGGKLTTNSGDLDAQVYLTNSSQVDLTDTAIDWAGGSNKFYVYGTSLLRLKNSGGYSVYNAYPNSGYIQPDTTYRHTNTGVSWKFYNAGQTAYTQEILVGKVAVNSGSQASVSVWGYGGGTTSHVILRVDGSNVGLGSSLTNDLSSATNNSYTWGEITVNFTPTSAGFVDVYLRYGDGTSDWNFGIFDDMSATQA